MTILQKEKVDLVPWEKVDPMSKFTILPKKLMFDKVRGT